MRKNIYCIYLKVTILAATNAVSDFSDFEKIANIKYSLKLVVLF